MRILSILLTACLPAVLIVPARVGHTIEPAEMLQVKAKRAEATPRRVRKVVRATELLGASLNAENKDVGEIEDAAFDLQTGHLALVVASQKVPSQEAVYTLIPFRDFRKAKFEWIDESTISKLPETITRAVANDVYVTYERDIYWINFSRQLEESLKQEFDQENFELTTFSFLKGRTVIDADREVVGHIIDLGINASTGRIVYCVLQTDDKKLRAIPLAAFVMEPNTYRWSIELTKPRILAFEPFDESSTPTNIDRGWKEYVAVRYGRDGLQSQKASNKKPEKIKPESDPKPESEPNIEK
jgi:sporulation protein YlmC with PRC-barrel domain